jgi:serine/threonine protein kinase
VVQQLGATFDSHAILAELGRGTTGIVYEARDLTLNRRVALKVLTLSPDADRQTKTAWFFRECRVLAHLTSKPGCNIPNLHMVAEHQGQPYYVRELVDGDTLERRVADGSIDLRAGLGVIAEVARVVDRVHGHGYAHRNLYPANVLVATGGTPKLIGFGRVGPLAGSNLLPPGASGVPPEIDVRALQEMLGWLCATLREPVPSALQGIQHPDAVSSPGALAGAIRCYLLGAPAEQTTQADRPRE